MMDGKHYKALIEDTLAPTTTWWSWAPSAWAR